ncbi:MAG: hypothetical protein KJ793_00770 [Candidatus Omnitrophica bacterium]|nr:hypothetical protein [Candidatus Omnitrophota bacterium]
MIKVSRKKAQSTLEYILLLTAIVGFIIFAAKSWVKPAAEGTLSAAWSVIDDAANEM